ncbi:nitrate/nitrite transporter NarK [Paraburkholderia sp. BL6669N2]|nr:nitrate/nitrite transporter NarK [Paraburkholderia sp. BL6669N2]
MQQRAPLSISRSETDSCDDAQSVYRRIVWRLCPILFFSYVIACIDRTNIGFAKIQMQSEIGLTDTVYGFGAGIFFIGYFLFELPSNLFLQRYGARRWISRIMVSWGVVSILMCTVHSPLTFYILRFLLGVAEAGLLPGVIFFLLSWLPRVRRSRFIAIIYSGSALSGIIGGPLSGYLMGRLEHFGGLGGWQWMFVLEGLPALVLAAVLYFTLDDAPQDAKWLSSPEKELVIARLDTHPGPGARDTIGGALRSGRLWWLTFIYFSQAAGYVGMTLWLPSLIHSSGVKSVEKAGILSSLPYIAAIVMTYFVSRSADQRNEYRWHVIVPQLIAAVGLVSSTYFTHDTIASLFCLALALSGAIAAAPPFWALPSEFLRGTGASAGVALISATGNLGGFASPFLIGFVRDVTGRTEIALWIIAGILVAGAIAVALLPKNVGNRSGVYT